MSGLSGIENATLKQYTQQLLHPIKEKALQLNDGTSDKTEISQKGALAGRITIYAVMQRSFGITSNTELGVVEKTDDFEEAPALFDFEAVAYNVLNFIDNVIGGARKNGASDDRLNALMEQARTGVDQGFKDARAELNKIGILDGPIGDGIDKSYDLIQDGLDDIKVDRYQSQSVQQPLASLSTQQTSTLELTTNDGDKVKLSFGHHFSGGLSHSEDGDTLSLMLNNRNDLMLSIEGDLNEQELQAIADLVVDIDGIGNQFFSGDLDSAFEQATQFGFDDNQIATFAVNFEMTHQIQINRGYGPQDSPLAQLLPNLNQFINDWESIKERTDKQFTEPQALPEIESAVFNDPKGGEDLPAMRLWDRFNQFTQRLHEAHYDRGSPV